MVEFTTLTKRFQRLNSKSCL